MVRFRSFGFIFVGFFLALSIVGSAQTQSEYRVVATPEEVMVGQNFQVQVSAPFNFSFDPQAIPITGSAELILGSMGTSQQTTIVNGIQTSSFSYTFTYSTKESGTVTVGPISVLVGTNTVEIGSASVKVLTPEELGIVAPVVPELGAISNPVSDSVSIMKQLSGNIFAGVTCRDEVYEGETFVVSTNLYYKNDSPVRNALPSNLFGIQNDSLIYIDQLSSQNNRSSIITESVPNLPYIKANIIDQIVYPVRTGNVEVHGVQMEFGAMSRFMRMERQYSIPAPKKQIKILPLPETSEVVQAKVVGSVQLSSNIDKSKAMVGDLVKVSYLISGDAYLKPVVLDNLEGNDSFLLTNQNSSFVQVTQNKYPVQTRKTFELSYQVLKPGLLELPQITVAIFNPETKEYKYEKSAPFTVQAEGTVQLSTAITESNNNQLDRSTIDRTLISKPKEILPFPYEIVATRSEQIFDNRILIIFNSSLMLLGIIVFCTRSFILNSSHYMKYKNLKKQKTEINFHIKNAEQALAVPKIDQCYLELEKALFCAVRTYGQTDINGIQLSELPEKLLAIGYPILLSKQIVQFLQNLEDQRYNPQKSMERAKEDFRMMSHLISQLPEFSKP